MKYGIETRGGEQLGQVGTALQPLEIQVRYESGDPVFQLPVRFRLISGDGHFEHRDDLTDIQGCAIAEFVPEKPGAYRIDCLVGGKGGEAVHFTGTVCEPTVIIDEAALGIVPAEQTRPEDVPDTDTTSTAAVMAEVDEYLEGLKTPETVQEATSAAAPAATASGEIQVKEAAAEPQPLDPEPQPETAGIDGEPTKETVVRAFIGEDDVAPVQQDTIGQCQPPTVAETGVADAADHLPEPKLSEPQPEDVPDIDRADKAAAARADYNWPKTGGKIGIAVLSLILALAIFGLVRYAVQRPVSPAPAPAGSGSIHCTSDHVKQVGHTYVFENCTVKP